MLLNLLCFFTDLSRRVPLDSSQTDNGSISNMQDNGIENIPSNEGSFGSTHVNTFMNAQVDSLGSVSTPSVFPGANIGSINNCSFQVYNGNVNVYGPKDKVDTGKD